MKSLLVHAPLLLSLAFALIGSSCSDGKKRMKIAFTKASGSKAYERYCEALKNSAKDYEIETIDLISMSPTEAALALKNCDGVVFPGGADIDPAKFGKPEDAHLCTIEPERDTLEFAVMKAAYDHKIPMLCICRGEQLLAVRNGGSLVTDIPSQIPNALNHQTNSPDTCFHDITVKEGSILAKLAGATTGRVNSYHHQSVEKPGKGFVVSASTSDGIIEAIEPADRDAKPFVIGVEWHPERLSKDNPFGEKLFLEFAKICWANKIGRKA